MRRYFDRSQLEALAGPFIELPILLCPVCRRASLELKRETFESLDSIASRDEDYEEPPNGFFHGSLSCPRTPCGNRYAIAGRWRMDQTDKSDDDDDVVYCESLSVTYILPAFPLMEYPDGVPDEVREAIAGASQVLLSDASAAANRIRSAIEVLLDSQRVHKFVQGSRSKRLTTHQRIEDFKSRRPDVANHLMAMKWIGNLGSHEREILPLPTVLDGMEHFARALELLYDRNERELERRAAFINRQGNRFRPRKIN